MTHAGLVNVFNIDEYSTASLVWPSILPKGRISRNKNIRVAYCTVQPRLRDCKDIEVVTGNCLFKKIEVFARRHRANVVVGDGHEMFSILSCFTLIYIHVFVSFLLLSWAGIQLYIAS